MLVSALWQKHAGRDIYVIGTGPSLRCFPLSYLESQITIGLNEAYKYADWTYHLTLHPEIAIAAVKAQSNLYGKWLVKRKRPLSLLPVEDPRFYFFEAGTRDPALGQDPWKKALINEVRRLDGEVLWQGGAAHCTAIHAALRMGARAIILVGCDLGSLGNDHHGHDQHVMFRGSDPDRVYFGYRHNAAILRRLIREMHGVPVFSLTPFLGSAAAEEDYERLVSELGLGPLAPPKEGTTEHQERKHDPQARDRV